MGGFIWLIGGESLVNPYSLLYEPFAVGSYQRHLVPSTRSRQGVELKGVFAHRKSALSEVNELVGHG